MAVKVREWLAHDDGDDDESNQEEGIDSGADQERKDVVKIQDDGDGTVQDSNANLDVSAHPY